jgi:hypothetical protein
MAGSFGAVQSALVMSMVPDELRGRALGLLTLAIGAYVHKQSSSCLQCLVSGIF